ncbi:MAG: tetratricopeptide repeat protein [Acidobacteriia bacterium]|nr:tetratricopeptide repeat protein [Terriglobia bacterium]
MSRSIQRGVVVAAAALLLSAAVAAGQMELAVITGIVTDEAGAPLEGVTFRLQDTNQGREIVFKSDKDGRFYRRGLKALDYQFVVEKDGYQPIQNHLKLNAGMDKRFNFKLVKAAPVGSEEFVKGVAAFNAGDNQGAVTAFEAAARKAPDSPEIKVNLALAYLRAGRSSDAVSELEKAAAMAPGKPQVLFQLGGAYVDAKMNDKAIAAFEAGLAKQPDLANPLSYEATITLGAVYFAAGRIDPAITRFTAALAAKPDAPAPKLGLAKCLFNKGDTDRALQLMEQVVASSPGTPEAAEAEQFLTAIKKTPRL